ncbi:hypothetical protein DRO21_06855, partial [archaeon]
MRISKNVTLFLGALAASLLVMTFLHVIVSASSYQGRVEFVTLGKNVYSVWFIKAGSGYRFRVVLKGKYTMCGREVNYLEFNDVRTRGEAVALTQAIKDRTINYVRVTCINNEPTADYIYYRPGYG